MYELSLYFLHLFGEKAPKNLYPQNGSDIMTMCSGENPRADQLH